MSHRSSDFIANYSRGVIASQHIQTSWTQQGHKLIMNSFGFVVIFKGVALNNADSVSASKNTPDLDHYNNAFGSHTKQNALLSVGE